MAMKPEDKRRVLSSVAALLAMPSYFFCGMAHFCIGGHMAHPPYPWYHFANEFGWLTFLVIALVFAFRANIPAKKTFIVLSGLMLAFRILGEGTLTLIMAVGLIVASIQGFRSSKTNKDRSNEAPEATSEPPPSAASSSPQG
jgi:hypothetical protein